MSDRVISKEEAKKLGEEHLNNRWSLGENNNLIIIDEGFGETDDYWIFHYESKLFIETDNPVYAIMFHPPLYVQKLHGFCRLGFPKGTQRSFMQEEDLEI